MGIWLLKAVVQSWSWGTQVLDNMQRTCAAARMVPNAGLEVQKGLSGLVADGEHGLTCTGRQGAWVIGFSGDQAKCEAEAAIGTAARQPRRVGLRAGLRA